MYLGYEKTDVCECVYVSLLSLLLSLSLSLALSAVNFSLVVPPPTGYTNSLSLIRLSWFPLPPSATLLLFIFFLSSHTPFSFLSNSYLVSFPSSPQTFLRAATGATQPAAPLVQIYRRSIFSTRLVYFILKISICPHKIRLFFYFIWNVSVWRKAVCNYIIL